MEISQDAPCMRFYSDTIAPYVIRNNSHVLQQPPQTMYEISANKYVPKQKPRMSVLSANRYVPPYKQYNPHSLNNVLLRAENTKMSF